MESRAVLSRPAGPPDRVLRYGPGPDHVADLRFPAWERSGERGAALIIFLHGGFWRAAYDRTHAGPLAAALAAEGFAVCTPEFRRIGQPEGGWPGTFDDVAAAVDALPGLVGALSEFSGAPAGPAGQSVGRQAGQSVGRPAGQPPGRSAGQPASAPGPRRGKAGSPASAPCYSPAIRRAVIWHCGPRPGTGSPPDRPGIPARPAAQASSPSRRSATWCPGISGGSVLARWPSCWAAGPPGSPSGTR